MADIMVRRNNAGQTTAPQRELEPFRALRDMLRWDPFREMAPIWPEVIAPAYMVPFEIKETRNALQFKADVPGIKEQDIDVTLTGNRLTVAGRKNEEKEEAGDTFYACERTYGSFSRTFTLPDGLDNDHVQADLRNGVLSIAIAKRPEYQPKKISVTSEKMKA